MDNAGVAAGHVQGQPADHPPGAALLPTRVEWNERGRTVMVGCSSDEYATWTPLSWDGQSFSVSLNLEPGLHWIVFCVDGVYRHNPNLNWQLDDSNRKVNCIRVPTLPEFYAVTRNVTPVSFSWNRPTESVSVRGSWGGGWNLMSKSHNDFYTVLDIPPGMYHYNFLVDGDVRIADDIAQAWDPNGTMYNPRKKKR